MKIGIEDSMQLSYKKFWELLLDRNMTRSELRLKAGICSSALAKLGKDEDITINILLKICSALQCNIVDIMGIIPIKSPRSERMSKLQKRVYQI